MAVLIGAHLRVEGVGAEYQGFLLPFDRIFDVGCAAGLVFLAWALGRSVFQHVQFTVDSAVDRLLFATAIGLGIEGTAVFGLGVVSLLHPAALAGLGLVLAWVAAGAGSDLQSDVREVAAELQGGLGRSGLLLLGGVAVLLLLLSATPPADWDVLTYHLEVPQEYLREGKIFLPIDNHHASFVGLQHMLNVPLLAVGAESAPAVLSAIFALLLAVTMYVFGRRVFDEATGRLGAALVWGSPAVLLVAVTARVDVTMTWLLVLCHYAVVVGLSRQRITGWFWTAAVVGGLAVATKLSAVAYLAGLAPVLAWTVVKASPSMTSSVSRLLGFGGVTVLVAAPWLAKNTVLLGAPFYPYLAELRLEPWLAEYLGAATVPDSIDADVFRIPENTRAPFSVRALFTDPGAITPEYEGAFYFGNFALFLLPFSIMWSRRKVVALLLPAAVYVGLVLYPDGHTNLRYLIPGLVIGTLVASHVIARLGVAAFSTPSLRRMSFAVMVVFCLLPAGLAIHHRVEELRPQQYWLGLQSEQEYLLESSSWDVSSIAGVRTGINEQMPDDARIVMLFEPRGFGFHPEVMQDNLSRTWPILAENTPWRDCLAPTEATHVLVNYWHLGSLLRRGVEIETLSWDAFARFARECLERKDSMPGAVLYEIVRRPTSARLESKTVDR